MLMETLAYFLEFLILTVFLSGVLWIMIKLQKLQYNFPGLLASAALASGLEMIPYVGHAFAVAALLLCLTKVTHESYTDVAFTVGVGYALMFGVNLFLLGWLMGDLRPSARDGEKSDEIQMERAAAVSNAPAQAAVPEPNPVPAPSGPAAAQPPPAPSVSPVLTKPTNSFAGVFTLKGLSKSANTSLAMVYSGAKTYTIGLGETVAMQTPAGKVDVTLEKVGDNYVVLSAAGQRIVVSK